MKRSIAVLTTSRADYSHLYWVMRLLDGHPAVEMKLIVSGAHLSPDFGYTADEIAADEFRIDERVECLYDADTDVGMARTIGQAALGLTDALDRLRPDLLLLIADRYEMLAPASVALALRISVAHIEGGEVSEGAIDDCVRNALTKLSHLHLTPTETARDRVLAMGEEPWRVHRVGAPSLDHLRRSPLLDRETLQSKLGLDLSVDPVVVAYHPVTIARDTLREADELFAALERMPGPLIFCFPNADAGGRELAARVRKFCGDRQEARVFTNLNPVDYWSLLSVASLMLGNSSSGIMETPSLALPTVNVGLRQEGRERARNIVDVAADRTAILDAVRHATADEYRASLRGMVNPYGDGRAAERIVDVLVDCPLGERLRRKRPSRGIGESP